MVRQHRCPALEYVQQFRPATTTGLVTCPAFRYPASSDSREQQPNKQGKKGDGRHERGQGTTALLRAAPLRLGRPGGRLC